MATTPPAEECLLVPFYLEGKAVGTIWAIAHDDRRKFDTEDLRQLESLGRFASAAYQAQTLGASEQHHAALRLEDALQSGQTMEKLNAEFRESEEALRRSERDLRDFVENAAVGLHWVGPDGASSSGPIKPSSTSSATRAKNTSAVTSPTSTPTSR